jgi:pyruvate,water dikinase
MLDQAHSPEPKSAALGAMYPIGFQRGFREGFSRYGLLLDGMGMATINGFTYTQPQPFTMPGPDGPLTPEQIGAEIGRRTGVAAETFATKRWRADLDEWDNVRKPASIARHRELYAVDLAGLDDAALADHLEVVREHMIEMIYQHHRYNIAALLPIGDFALQAAGWLHRDPRSLLDVLDGYSPLSNVAADELKAVLDDVRADPDALAILHGGDDPSTRLAALRERVPSLDDYLGMAGCRIIEGFDLLSPTIVDRPELLLGRLAAAVEIDPDESRRRADQQAAAYREQVPQEHHEAFDELLAEARAVYRLRDERGVYSDITAIGLVRLAMLEAGRRLVAAGVVDDVELALDADVEGLAAHLRGQASLTEADLAAARDRRIAMEHVGAPRLIGPPPPPPPPVDQLPPPLARLMSSIGFVIDGVLGELEHPIGDDTTIVGIPVSSGVYEGRARLVRNLDDLFELESGDILVARTTGEAFNSMLHLVKAIVTDHGSFASHAGIVSREMGIPAVVGTVNGTSRIRDGATIRVDGAAGEVTVLD